MSKRIHIVAIALLCMASVNFFSCNKDEPTPTPLPPAALPVISSFSPLTATTGEPVKIIGKDFITATAVSFGGTAAQSFKIISDSVIFANVATGASGNVSVTSPGGNASLAGFTFYTPQEYTLYGTSAYGWIPWPQKDSSFYNPVYVLDTAIFIIKKINRYDSVAIRSHNVFPEYSPYVDSPNYVIISGVGLDGKGGYRFFATSSPTARPMSIFAKIVDTVITIPTQAPIATLVIKGSGVIKNNKISLQYLADYRGMSKSSSLKTP